MDEIRSEGRIPKESQGGKRALILVGSWVIFTAIVLAIGLPIVRSSIRQSGVLLLLQSAPVPSQGAGKYQAEVWFFTPGGSLKKFSQQQTRGGGSAYHDTFECLLAGPKLQALQSGAVSSIKRGTTLRGLTLSNKVLYIDLSRHFMESEDLQGAYEQLKKTGKGFSQIKDIVLLIEGEQVTLTDEL